MGKVLGRKEGKDMAMGKGGGSCAVALAEF